MIHDTPDTVDIDIHVLRQRYEDAAILLLLMRADAAAMRVATPLMLCCLIAAVAVAPLLLRALSERASVTLRVVVALC